MLKKLIVEEQQGGELSDASDVHPRDLGSNLGMDRKYFLMFLLRLSSNM